MAKESSMTMGGNMSKEMGMSNGRGGHLYMQTNETRNAVVHYHRGADGKITEVDRVSTGGAGSGTFKPISGQESAPNAFEGAGSVILSPDRRFLFTTNGGDNSVSSFAVAQDGRLTLVDRKLTGNPIDDANGNAGPYVADGRQIVFTQWVQVHVRPGDAKEPILSRRGPDEATAYAIDGKRLILTFPSKNRYILERLP